MKKGAVFLKWVVVAICFSIVFAIGTAQEIYAGCDSHRVDCNIDKGTKMVGHSNFSYCFGWGADGLNCYPCHGYAHLAKWCNANVEKCNGKCWGCARFDYECYDSNGNRKKSYDY